MANKKYTMFIVVTNDQYELPMFLGTSDEVAEWLNVKRRRVYEWVNIYRKGRATPNMKFKVCSIDMRGSEQW